MRIFLAGASGAIGRPLVPLLVAAGHAVAGTTRSESKAELLRELGAEPVVLDVYDAAALRDAVVAFAPDLVIHQLTDLPDDAADLPAALPANARMRAEGTANLIAAASAAGAERFLAQSIAWVPPGGGESREGHEQQVLDHGGVVLRYGIFYGPLTYNEDGKPSETGGAPTIEVGAAARRTLRGGAKSPDADPLRGAGTKLFGGRRERARGAHCSVRDPSKRPRTPKCAGPRAPQTLIVITSPSWTT